jgi:prophage regulatory protein
MTPLPELLTPAEVAAYQPSISIATLDRLNRRGGTFLRCGSFFALEPGERCPRWVLALMNPSGTTPKRFVRLRQAKDMLGLSKSAIYARIAQGTFPKPVSLGGHSVAWIESEVTARMHASVDVSRGQSTASAA